MDDETRARRDRCTTFLTGDGNVRPADLLATIDDSAVPDTYGDGGVVAELESAVAELLGFPAAVFLPSGTMAQAATLRVHADARGRRTVLWHPTCHLNIHEDGAYSWVHGLVGRPVGDPNGLPTLEDLEAVAEPVAALLLELPLRELGGLLPDWDDLTAQVAWAREQGAAAHLDGARLWEASAGYGKTPAEIAGLFAHARAIAAALTDVAGIRVLPDPPQTSMMHLFFDVTRERFIANAQRLADEQGIWVWPKPMSASEPGMVRCELTVGRATCRLEPGDIARILESLCS